MRSLIPVIGVLASLVVAALASTSASAMTSLPAASRVTVPKLHCYRLDRAEDALHRRGLKVRERGGGIFGIVVKSNWVVTSQNPRGGTRVKRGTRVTLYGPLVLTRPPIPATRTRG